MRCFVLITALLAVVSGLSAQDDEMTTISGISLSSQRVVRGVKRSGAGAVGTFQIARDGWQMGGEWVQPFDRDEPTEGAVKASYGWRQGSGFKLEALVTPRWYTSVAPGVTTRTFEAGFSAVWTLPSDWSVELTALHDFRLKAETLQITLNYSQPLKKLGAYLEWSASVGTATARDLLPDAVGLPVHDSYLYYSASIRLPYRIGPHTTLVAGCQIAGSDSQNRFWSPIWAPGRVRASADLGLSFDF